ncbi:MAG TPA: hypothetical protein VM582_01330 [Candidatus Thermoplasmatota archaeon]|nr:hypothetical protein [Candidatus Thermoplasmatota archaeon]
MRSHLALAALLLLAGCVTPAAVDPGALAAQEKDAMLRDLRALLADVPCEVASVGAQTSDNMLEIANLPYDGSEHGEIDARGDWLLVARYQAGGFEVVSLADPGAPALVSVFQSEEENAQDVKWMPDDRTAVVGVNRKVLLVDVGPVIDAAGSMTPERMADAGIAPVLLGEWEYPRDPRNPHDFIANMHMLTTARIGETDYVFVAPNTDTGVWLLKREGDALEHVTHFGAPLGGSALGPHDMSLAWDEKMQAPVLYVANGFEGWLAWDVSVPETPKLLAVMPNLDPGAVSYTHSALGAWVGDRRLVVTIGEVGVNMMKVYDATNWQAPVLLGVWWADKARPHMPQHNIQIVGERLYVAHYTEGVLVFDLSTIGRLPLLSSLGIAPIARYAPPERETPDSLGFGNVWDVVVHRGLLYVNDMSRGTAVVGYGCLLPGDEAATSVN